MANWFYFLVSFSDGWLDLFHTLLDFCMMGLHFIHCVFLKCGVLSNTYCLKWFYVLFVCRKCGQYSAKNVSIHWNAEKRRKHGMGVQRVSAASLHKLQVHGQQKTIHLGCHLSQKNAGNTFKLSCLQKFF